MVPVGWGTHRNAHLVLYFVRHFRPWLKSFHTKCQYKTGKVRLEPQSHWLAALAIGMRRVRNKAYRGRP
eukprot:1155504-Pelagomonas_calceolata.AAC.2